MRSTSRRRARRPRWQIKSELADESLPQPKNLGLPPVPRFSLREDGRELSGLMLLRDMDDVMAGAVSAMKAGAAVTQTPNSPGSEHSLAVAPAAADSVQVERDDDALAEAEGDFAVPIWIANSSGQASARYTGADGQEVAPHAAQAVLYQSALPFVGRMMFAVTATDFVTSRLATGGAAAKYMLALIPGFGARVRFIATSTTPRGAPPPSTSTPPWSSS